MISIFQLKFCFFSLFKTLSGHHTLMSTTRHKTQDSAKTREDRDKTRQKKKANQDIVDEIIEEQNRLILEMK